jgi:shikimate kinase/3-dehydroquinate synthase
MDGAGAIVFIGFMGSGKSTAARALAECRGVVALDSDAEVEKRLGHTIAEEFERGGERRFRELEEQVVLELLQRVGQEDVLSLGGGSVLSQRVREALAEHLVVLMDVDPQTAWERVDGRGATRPLARDRDAFVALHAEREPLYDGLADAILPAESRDSAPAIARSLESLRLAPRGTRLVWATAASGDYPVLFGRGLVSGGGTRTAWPLPREGSRAFGVSDEHVAPLYAAGIGPLQDLIVLPPGESAKTLGSAELVWEALLRAGMTRGDHVLALGGGVVGDLAGFCAATYQRGVPVVQVPTTLVAQVDSAYGGKTGVDLREAKNYVGAYHQPAAVIVDPATLATLPERELSAGWVEAIKTALIAGGSLWERVRAAKAADDETILSCARTKLAVVARDERDGGARQTLNLGHTIGHAIETATSYERFLHGEAVGLGLLAALRLSGAQELREEVGEMLSAASLPTRLSGVTVDEVLAATKRDKKRFGDGPVPFVLLRAPGELEIGVEVGPRDLRAAVRELCEA